MGGVGGGVGAVGEVDAEDYGVFFFFFFFFWVMFRVRGRGRARAGVLGIDLGEGGEEECFYAYA